MLYPVYALLFADTGLSAAQISSLFVLWSVTGVVLEVPSGLWADVVSRRRLLMAGPALTAAGFASWTFGPSYPAFAAGFVLWGTGSALQSGTLQAVVYTELDRLGAQPSYPRLIGRSRACGSAAIMISTGLAAPVMTLGGYRLAGVLSVAVVLLGVPLGALLPDSRGQVAGSDDLDAIADHHATTDLDAVLGPGSVTVPDAVPDRGLGLGRNGSDEPVDDRGAAEGGDGDTQGFVTVLRVGLAELRRSRAVRRAVWAVVIVTGLVGLDEYISLLIASTGVGTSTVPLLTLFVSVGEMAGGWLAGRGAARMPGALAVAAVCLMVGAGSGHPAGIAGVAVAFGIFQWAIVTADARLQAVIPDRARATVTSMAGGASEVGAIAVFGCYAAGSVWFGPGVLFALAGLPFLAVAALLTRGAGSRRNGQDE